ncbi:MAG: methyltransferase family protein [Candidatus Hermodarchaeota archaeon]
MSLIPEFELGLWNAWIFIISYFLYFLLSYLIYRLRGVKGLSRPMTPPLNEKEKIVDHFATLGFLASVIYSIFLPLKLGTAWFYIGLFVYLFGMIFNIVAGTNFVNTPLDRPATKGLYRISRNPIYLGTFLIFIGIGIACASWLFLLLVAVLIVLQHILVVAEERWCLEKYGDAYREYMNRTPKWIGIPKSRKTD